MIFFTSYQDNNAYHFRNLKLEDIDLKKNSLSLRL